MPHINDSLFGNSVIFMCEHDKKGAMGLIINKRFEKNELKDKEILDKIFSQVEIINTYRNDINSQTFEERAIKTMAEVYYWGDMSAREIVQQLTHIKLLPEYDADNKSLFEDHIKLITSYIGAFPEFDADMRRSKIK